MTDVLDLGARAAYVTADLGDPRPDGPWDAVALTLGASEVEWEAALRRMQHDRCATVADALAWLREAGFADVDCPWREGRFAVLAARRAS